MVRPAAIPLVLLVCAVSLICSGCQSVPVSTLSFLSEPSPETDQSEQLADHPDENGRTSPYQRQANELVQQAVNHYSNGELSQAKVLLASAREIDPGHIG
ncbi:MAG: hypothetical protein KDA74_14515, partial [Planctomycetaceae bacterium]|nr:hypothetical protein [Planctomycetaceae bacterium]